MVLDIPLGDLPDSAFSGPNRTLPLASNQYVYLYSHFGTQILNAADTSNGGSANDGFEEWATPTLGTVASTTTTTIYLGATGTTPLPAQCRPSPPCTTAQRLPAARVIPTGNVSFFFYNTIDGSGTPVGAGTVALDANGVANPSDAEGPLIPGDYSFAAHYNGDTTYLPSDSPVEPLTIAKASPSLSTTILSPTTAVTAGNVTVQDRATISGGFNPTGTLSFVLDDANNTAIAGTSYSTTFSAPTPLPLQFFTNLKPPPPPPLHSPPPRPPPHTPRRQLRHDGGSVSLATGSYHWVVSATGDANNNAPPDVTNETFAVGKASPTLSTTILPPSDAVTAGSVTVRTGPRSAAASAPRAP